MEREALRLAISRYLPELEVAGEAANGRQLIEMAERLKPDALLLDIQMPGLTGLEALRELKARLPEMRCVVISAYDSFHYAQQALQLGADDYLLKPTHRDRLVKALAKVVSQLDQQRARRTEELRQLERWSQVRPLLDAQLAASLLVGPVRRPEVQVLLDALGLDFAAGLALVASLHERSFPSEMESGAERNLGKEKAYALLQQLLGTVFPRAVSTVTAGYAVVFVEADVAQDEYRTRVWSMESARRLRDRIRDELGIRFRMGLGRVHQGVEGLYASFREALLASQDTSVSDKVNHYADLHQSNPMLELPPSPEERLWEHLQRADGTGLREELEAWWQDAQALPGAAEGPLHEALARLFVGVARRVRDAGWTEIGEGAVPPRDLASADLFAWVRDILDRWAHAQGQAKRSRLYLLMRRAEGYMQAHLAEEVTLEQVAREVAMSPYYFSKVFRQITGETFIDYLTRVRVEKAKQMLAGDGASVKEASFAAGYSDPNYFSRVFKKVTGMTPTEFRGQRP
ncbi:MAG: helix-turn-helix domain-containing protein [Firmicutes bacterium]|nr:helix-turn-helix domain-containing protein [Bacillota bacterium]